MRVEHEADNSGEQSPKNERESLDSIPNTGTQQGYERIDLNQFPWWFLLVNVPELLRKLDMPGVDPQEAALLLGSLSEVMKEHDVKLPDNVRLFIQGVESLTSESRYSCCDEQGAFVAFRSGKALIMDPWRFVESDFTDNEPFCTDDPIGWIWNALRFVKLDDLPMIVEGIGAEFQPCPALNIEPFEGKSKPVSDRITPFVYLGDDPVEDAVHAIQAAHWLSYATQAYEALGNRIQEIWTKQVPRASEPDPLYRLLVCMDVDSFLEASVFFRQASKELRKSADLPEGSPTVLVEPSVPRSQVEVDGKRPAYARDHLFLTWYEADGAETYHSQAKIRDKWNKMSLEEQRDIYPASQVPVTRAVVIQAVKKAQSESDDVG